MITEYTGEAAEIVIPPELDGHAVTAIGDFTFFGCSSLASAAIPGSVASIGRDAFPKGTSFTVPRDSYAAQWATDNGYACDYSDAPDRMHH